jgi:HD-GYP domain-containing protein (c-di-GMP phosphodiesterase class II)
MRRVSVEELQSGDRLGRDIYGNPQAPPLLRSGVRMSDSYRQSLLRAGIHTVWVDDELSEGIEPIEILEEDTKRRATVAIHNAFRHVAGWVPQRGPIAPRVVAEMTEIAELIIEDISRHVHSALALNDLASSDGYTLKHSLAVTTLGLSLGVRAMRTHGWIDASGQRRYDGIEQRLSELGVGLLLHDIGKLAVPQEILHKPGALSAEEWDAMRAHPMLGVQILQKADDISPLSRAVVRSHHERWNGSGYPDGRAKDDIHQFARIAAVADVFDALTSDRCYRNGVPPHEGYQFILDRTARDFDPQIVEIFESSVAPYPPGSSVLLSDGTMGLIKDVVPGAVMRPIVRIIADATGRQVSPYEVDLRDAAHLSITGHADVASVRA